MLGLLSVRVSSRDRTSMPRQLITSLSILLPEVGILAPIAWRPGPLPSRAVAAMQFSPVDPGSQIVVPPSPNFDNSRGTIAFWMKSPGNDTGFGDYAAIIFDRRTDFGDGDVITVVD